MLRRRVDSPSASDDGTRSWQRVDGGISAPGPAAQSAHGHGQPPSRDDIREAVDRLYADDPWALNAAIIAQTQRVRQHGAGSAAAMEIPVQWAQYAPPGAARLGQCQVPPAAAQDATPCAAPAHNASHHYVKGCLSSWLVSLRSSSFWAWGGRVHCRPTPCERPCLQVPRRHLDL